MELQIIDTVRALREELHTLAERSGEEKRTKARLMEFLRENTSLRIDDYGQWFCAVHEEADAPETIAFRADMDALPFGDGASHLCGHDGHSASLAGLALLIGNKKIGRNIVLIFQHAEEIGVGGAACSEVVGKYRVDRIYAFHNIPGWPEGSILLRRDTFACASMGVTISFIGAPSHAAYPENGRNPGFAAARFIAALPEIADPTHYRGLAMATLIGADIGTRAFGTAAGRAEVWLTLRAWREEYMNHLLESIKKTAEIEASRDEVKAEFSFCDVFPSTVNDNAVLARLERVCRENKLDCAEVPEPFRWSEDFGYYGAKTKAVMVGIGAGLDWPQLHTENYSFNDNILPTALTLFSSLAEFG
jgi:amidohydrolase